METETWQWWRHVLDEAIATAKRTGRKHAVYSVKQRGPWGAPWEYFMRDTVQRRGLCADRSDHKPHLHNSETLGTFMCSGDQDDREPYRSERRRSANARIEA